MARTTTHDAKGTDYDDSLDSRDCAGRIVGSESFRHPRNGRPILTPETLEEGCSNDDDCTGYADADSGCSESNGSHTCPPCADHVTCTTLREELIMTTATIKLDRAIILNEVIAKIGLRRALEAAEPNVTPEPNKWGVVGVDYTGGKFRARIRFCDASTGQDVRITLMRTDSLEDADYAYRAAHVALWGSASWAACDDFVHLLRK